MLSTTSIPRFASPSTGLGVSRVAFPLRSAHAQLRTRSLCCARAPHHRPRGDDESSSASSPGDRNHEADAGPDDTTPVFNAAPGQAQGLGNATDAWNSCLMLDGDTKDECYADFGVDSQRVEMYLDNVKELEASWNLKGGTKDESEWLLMRMTLADALAGIVFLGGMGLLILPGVLVGICMLLFETMKKASHMLKNKGPQPSIASDSKELYVFSESDMCFKKYDVDIREHSANSLLVSRRYMADEGM